MKKNNGFCWHVHHNTLLEYCYDYEHRVEAIKAKPKKEVEARLRLFKFVKGKLPGKLLEIGKALDEAWEGLDEAEETFDKAEKAFAKARKAYKKKIDVLHKKECPNCSWNGKKIVFKK